MIAYRTLAALLFALTLVGSAAAAAPSGRGTPSAVKGTEKTGLLLMTNYKYDGLSQAQRELYIKGFLETVSFSMYRAQASGEAQRQFGVWTACAESQPLADWQTYGWRIKGELHRTAASQFLEMASIVCKEAKEKPGARPVRLVSAREWQRLGLRDRAVYLMAYVETVYEISRVMKQADDVRHLDICLGHQGAEGLLDAVETINMEWQYPLPWSISRALGKACRPYRD